MKTLADLQPGQTGVVETVGGLSKKGRTGGTLKRFL